MKEEKTAAEILAEKLCMNPQNAALLMSSEEIAKADKFAKDIKNLLPCVKLSGRRLHLQ